MPDFDGFSHGNLNNPFFRQDQNNNMNNTYKDNNFDGFLHDNFNNPFFRHNQNNNKNNTYKNHNNVDNTIFPQDNFDGFLHGNLNNPSVPQDQNNTYKNLTNIDYTFFPYDQNNDTSNTRKNYNIPQDIFSNSQVLFPQDQCNPCKNSNGLKTDNIIHERHLTYTSTLSLNLFTTPLLYDDIGI